MKNLFLMGAFLLSSQAFAAIPSNGHACFLMMEGERMETAVYSCDGNDQVSLLRKVNSDGETSASICISAHVSEFVEAGYKVVSCQYVPGLNSEPQYTCTFVK